MDFERLVDRHKDHVYKQMVRTCGNHEDAEDALADAILAALKASEQLRDPAQFQAWLAKIGTRSCARMRVRDRLVRSTSLDYLTSQGFEVSNLLPDAAEQLETETTKRGIEQAVLSLPQIYRDVYVRREVQGESAEAVASEFGLSIAAIKSRLHRARHLVRAELDKLSDCL